MLPYDNFVPRRQRYRFSALGETCQPRRASAQYSTRRSKPWSECSRNQRLGATHEPDNQTDDDERADKSVSEHLSLRLLLKFRDASARVLFRFEHSCEFSERLLFVKNNAE